ncbi:MAG: metallophosphoesterase [Bacteroidales bacterium]|nr:metallophosphoesterase [Bacteroidales bacterium]
MLKNKALAYILASIHAVCICIFASAQDPVLLNKIRQARYVSSSPKVASLGVLHYSDLHGDSLSTEKLVGVISEFEPLIDAVINTGDAVHMYAEPTPKYPHASEWWRQSELAGKSLYVLGNHDGVLKFYEPGKGLDDLADWDSKGKEWEFDTYFADFVDKLGYTMPQGYDDPSSPYYKSCFWLKDFVPAKIRIIGLDCLHFKDNCLYNSTEQEAWLSARLDDTLDPSNPAYGYSVIIACHYPLDDFSGDNSQWDEASHRFIYNRNPGGGRVMDQRTNSVTNFHTPVTHSFKSSDRFSLNMKSKSGTMRYGFAKEEGNPFGDIVQSWVDKGGKFIVWLSGHCHNDMFYYPARYPKLLCLAIEQAGNLRGNITADRGEDLDSRLCANYYGIDTQNGLLKIVRIGLSMNRFMVSKDVLCYDYVNKVVIFE